jgi:hypothetical protein
MATEGVAMGRAVAVRADYTAGEARRLAKRADAAQARRLLVAFLEGMAIGPLVTRGLASPLVGQRAARLLELKTEMVDRMLQTIQTLRKLVEPAATNARDAEPIDLPAWPKRRGLPGRGHALTWT